MKRKIYLLLSIVAISWCFHMSIKADVNDTSDTSTNISEEETTFDYSKMDKNFKYRENWEDYYDISLCSNVKVSKSSYSYTGKEIKPVINVQVHDTKSSKVNKTLDKKYYTVEWKNNINPGTATAIVKGINGFYGEKKVTFKIKIATPKISSIKVKGSKIVVKTKKNSAVTKYQIRYKKNTGKTKKYLVKTEYLQYSNYKTTGKWKNLSSNKNTIKTKKLKKGNYFVQLRTYTTINGKKYYSNWKVYNALVNVKTKKANKNNFKYNGFIAPNKFNKIKKNPGTRKNFSYYKRSTKGLINNISNCSWTIYDYNKNKVIYHVVADKYGNIIKY